MDALHADDIRRARETPPSEKLRQACELMAFGINLQRQNLRRRNPAATDEEIEALLMSWMLEDH